MKDRGFYTMDLEILEKIERWVDSWSLNYCVTLL